MGWEPSWRQCTWFSYCLKYDCLYCFIFCTWIKQCSTNYFVTAKRPWQRRWTEEIFKCFCCYFNVNGARTWYQRIDIRSSFKIGRASYREKELVIVQEILEEMKQK